MNSVKLTNYNDHYLLAIVRDDGSTSQFVVCSFYEPTKPFGDQWLWGHYFSTLESAMNYWHKQVIENPTYDRLDELCRQLVNGMLIDNRQEALIYFEDSCEMTESEMKYLGV